MGRNLLGRTWNGIYELEELEKNLEKYKGILSPMAFEYLESILHLEISVIKKEISDDDRIVLSNLPIYGHISKFNLYHGVLNLMKNKRSVNCVDHSYTGNMNYISISSKEGTKSRYMYEYNFGKDYIKIHDFLPDDEKIKEEIKRQKYELRHISVPGGRNVDFFGDQLVGGPDDLAISAALNKYDAIEKRIKELELKKGLTENDKKVIKLSKKISDLFLEEYGLTNEDFTEMEVSSKILEKSYVIIPNTVKVYKEIHYI